MMIMNINAACDGNTAKIKKVTITFAAHLHNVSILLSNSTF